MAANYKAKIKLLRSKLEEFKKMISEFYKIDKHLKDSEVFLNLQISDLADEYKMAKELNSDILSSVTENDDDFASYISDKVFHGIQSIYFKHSTTLHELLKIVCNSSDRHDMTFTDLSQSTFQKINMNPSISHLSSPLLNDLTLSLLNCNITAFDGTYEAWPEFKDQFICNIHENQNLNDSAKIKLLRNLLRGDALKLIKREFTSLKSTDYESVWEKLTKRYDHKRTLVYSYFRVLVFHPVIEHETADNIKKIYDTTLDSLNDLKKLGLNTCAWDDLIVYIVLMKLPLKTREHWDERISKSDALPKFQNFMEFLDQRFRFLESQETTRKTNNEEKRLTTKKLITLQTTQGAKQPQSSTKSGGCKLCKNVFHPLRKCNKFLQMNSYERRNSLKSLGYCFNCLSYSHKIEACKSDGRCANCGEKHHTLIHFEKNSKPKSLEASTSDQYSQPTALLNTISDENTRFTTNVDTRFNTIDTNQIFSNFLCESTSSVIFPTALIRIINFEGQSVVLRAVIDSCSDASYITQSAAQSLNLELLPVISETRGLGDVVTAESKSITSFQMQSLVNSSFIKPLNAFVVPKIGTDRPLQNFRLKRHESLTLADPTFNKKSKIDLLLGDGIDSLIKLKGFLKSDIENICFQETLLGWIVSGSVSQPCSPSYKCAFLAESTLKSLDVSIRKFWELEEIPDVRSLTAAEQQCEDHYNATTLRLANGRYCVSLPFSKEITGFKDMRRIAINRLMCLERRFQKDSKLKKEYSDCLNEYIDVGHMHEIDPKDFVDGYYIPHHCVIKESSTTTKLRVVFDASARDANSESLNSCLLNGPRLQYDLLDLLVQFRFHKIAFTADIAQMYRQIIVNPADTKHQLIVWRDDTNKPIKSFAIDVVTFGTTSAPYLAVKTLLRLADDEESKCPLASKCLRQGFYVDDCIWGADTIEEAKEIQKELLTTLKSAGFHLRKWSANHTEILNAVPEADRETQDLFDFDSKSSVKTLGISWCPKSDSFHFKISIPDHDVHTKRTVLSDVAKIFDPLGWLAPSIISAKILIQELWSEKKDWDEPLSSNLNETWGTLRKGLENISSISLPRWVQTTKEEKIEIHGFCDASTKAYAAAVYVKSESDGFMSTNLLLAKTKVAPLKNISLPRLELMGAVLLSKLVDHIKKILKFHIHKYYYWSDSEITLAWIKDEPHKRCVFVANRITEIQKLSDPSDWRYVHTKENPADLGTRGVDPCCLPNLHLWWYGPEFIKKCHSYKEFQPAETLELPVDDNVKMKPKPTKNIVLETFLSARKTSISEISANIIQFRLDALNKYSTLSKLVRVVAYCLRFLKQNRTEQLTICTTEFDKSLLTICKMVQEEVFHDEILLIQNNKMLNKKNSLFSLNPFINSVDNLLRVSGRLGNASHLNYDQKFPIILPKNHAVSELIARYAHRISKHGTFQETLMIIWQRFHIIKCKNLVRKVIFQCVTCFRQRCTVQKQQMGLLPQTRITPNRPFLNCGVDFAGPYTLKRNKGRCKSLYKSYFAIFICFATKAIHLEVVPDLSTKEFIAAFIRFISRRGLVRNLYSDCGTNFMGARKKITRSLSDVHKKWNEDVSKELSEFKTQWHNNPPAAPHFGGLWEAGVKSVKYHLRREIKDLILTYDEFETILTQIESILNSRPLCQVTDNPDMFALTPGHFLVQDSLLSLPDNNLAADRKGHLDRFTTIQKLVQDFWKVWSTEYLNSLRQRKKWHNNYSNVKVGDVVVIKEDNLPPNSWMLARITEVHPGSDGLVRVVTLKTKSKTLQRPIVKVCPLPIN